MKKILLFICLSVFFIGCKHKQTLNFSTETYALKSENNCFPNNCANIHLEVPKISGNSTIAKNIENDVYAFITNSLSFDHLINENNYNTIINEFIANYDNVYKTYPTEATAWEANYKLNQKSISKSAYQMVYDYYLFTGSAHAIKGKKSFIFDVNDGKQIAIKDLFLNFEGFKKLAKENFTEQTKNTLNKNVRLFEGFGFQLPQAIYFENNEWVLHYNAYEIASNALEETIIKIPENKITPLLNPLHFKN